MVRFLRSSVAAFCALFLLLGILAAPANAAGEFLLLARYDGFPGDTFDVRGHQFGPNSPVTVTFEGETKTATTDSGGNFATSAFTIPYRLPGNYAVTATQSDGHKATGSIYVNGYYPWAGPAAYYVLPGYALGFYGRHFAPYEMVQLFDAANALIASFTADGGGSVDTANTVPAVPWSWKDTKPSYKMVGQKTGAVSNFQLVVGNYWPNITPSSYYVPFNKEMTVKGESFAPNEPVDLYINGTKVQTKNADGGGNLTWNITSPGSGMDFSVKGMGQWSGTVSTRTVTLAQPGWAI